MTVIHIEYPYLNGIMEEVQSLLPPKKLGVITMASRHLQHIEKMLEDYNLLKEMIEQDKLLLEEEVSLKGLSYDNEKVGKTNKFHSETEQEIINKYEIEKRLKNNIMKLKKIDAAMRLLSAVQRTIIKDFYIEQNGWIQLSYKVSMSIRQCQRERDKALSKLNMYLYGEKKEKRTGNSQMVLDVLKVN